MKLWRAYRREIVIGCVIGALLSVVMIGWIMHDVKTASRTCVCKLLTYYPDSSWDAREYGFPHIELEPGSPRGFTQFGIAPCPHGVNIHYSFNAETYECHGSVSRPTRSRE